MENCRSPILKNDSRTSRSKRIQVDNIIIQATYNYLLLTISKLIIFMSYHYKIYTASRNSEENTPKSNGRLEQTKGTI